jgi:hypothetical protein
MALGQMETFGVTFTPEKLKALKAALVKHKHDEEFEFDGHQWVTSYAKYLAAYLEGVFLAAGRNTRRKAENTNTTERKNTWKR